MLTYTITRYVTADERNNCAGRPLALGEVLYEFKGNTYGCCDLLGGVAVTEDPQGGNPFFEVPRAAVAIIGCDHDSATSPTNAHCTDIRCAAFIGRCDRHVKGRRFIPCTLEPVYPEAPPETGSVRWETAGTIRGDGGRIVCDNRVPEGIVAAKPGRSDTELRAFPLTIADTCDGCGALALVRLIKGADVLDFCGHDFHEQEVALVAHGWDVVECHVEPVI
jgi:hypothetical protein